MKLILTQEVTGLGAPGDVVEVKDGYGRNFLIPRGFGIRWTRGAEKTIESIKTARTSRALRDQDHAAEVKAKLEASPVNVAVRAGSGGRLFGSVTVAEIADALAATSGEPVDKRTIVVGNPIKSLGAHEVSVQAARRGVCDRGPQRRLRLTFLHADPARVDGRVPSTRAGSALGQAPVTSQASPRARWTSTTPRAAMKAPENAIQIQSSEPPSSAPARASGA